MVSILGTFDNDTSNKASIEASYAYEAFNKFSNEGSL